MALEVGRNTKTTEEEEKLVEVNEKQVRRNM